MHNLDKRYDGKGVFVGALVVDLVTALPGVVTARAEYLSGEPRVLIEGVVDGKPTAVWVPAARVEVTGHHKLVDSLFPPAPDVAPVFG